MTKTYRLALSLSAATLGLGLALGSPAFAQGMKDDAMKKPADTMAKPGATYGRGDILRRVGDLRQWGGTRLVTLEEGAERGVRVAGLRFALRR